MEAARPLCKWLLAAVGLAALGGCKSGDSSAALSARGQSPPELPGPLSPAGLPPVLPSQPLASTSPPGPIQAVPLGGSNAPVQGLPISTNASGTPVQGLPITLNTGAPVQGLPVYNGNVPVPVQGSPVNAGPITPVSMVAPAPDRTLIGKSANPTRESLPQVPDSLPQVKLKALVGTNPVTDQEVKEAVRMRLGEYRELQGSARLEKEKAIEREELRKIIERELIIDDMFSRLKKNKKNTEDIKELVAQSAEQSLRTIRNQQGARTEEEFIVMLRAQGLTIPILRRQIERQMMADEYVRGLLKDLGRTPGFAEIRAYYDQHPDKFKSEDRVRWQDIFISVNNFPNAAAARAHAEKVRQLAVEGTDFISLIKAQERTPSGRQNWDGIGTNRQTVPADVAPTVWALQPGQISAIIETPVGFHIVKVVEREYEGVRPFDIKVQNECRDRLRRQYREIEYKKLIEDLWRKGTVDIYDVS